MDNVKKDPVYFDVEKDKEFGGEIRARRIRPWNTNQRRKKKIRTGVPSSRQPNARLVIVMDDISEMITIPKMTGYAIKSVQMNKLSLLSILWTEPGTPARWTWKGRDQV